MVETRSVLMEISSQLRRSLMRTGRVHSTSRLLRSEHETETPLRPIERTHARGGSDGERRWAKVMEGGDGAKVMEGGDGGGHAWRSGEIAFRLRTCSRAKRRGSPRCPLSRRLWSTHMTASVGQEGGRCAEIWGEIVWRYGETTRGDTGRSRTCDVEVTV